MVTKQMFSMVLWSPSLEYKRNSWLYFKNFHKIREFTSNLHSGLNPGFVYVEKTSEIELPP